MKGWERKLLVLVVLNLLLWKAQVLLAAPRGIWLNDWGFWFLVVLLSGSASLLFLKGVQNLYQMTSERVGRFSLLVGFLGLVYVWMPGVAVEFMGLSQTGPGREGRISQDARAVIAAQAAEHPELAVEAAYYVYKSQGQTVYWRTAEGELKRYDPAEDRLASERTREAVEQRVTQQNNAVIYVNRLRGATILGFGVLLFVTGGFLILQRFRDRADRIGNPGNDPVDGDKSSASA